MEYLNHQLFLYATDLQRKLELLQEYYNKKRVHSSLNLLTPGQKAGIDIQPNEKLVSLENYRWKSHCKGLYQLPVAA